MRRGLSRMAAKNDGQTFFPGADDHDLGVTTERQFLGRFDSFPFEKVFVDPFGHDFLETGNAFRFDLFALASCFSLVSNGNAEADLLG